MRAVLCGDGHSVQKREQWTDGSNFVALGQELCWAMPAVHTAKAMGKAGLSA